MVVALVVAGIGAGIVLTRGEADPEGADGPGPTSGPPSSTGAASEDQIRGSLLEYVTAEVPATSANSIDNAQNVTTYDAGNMLDADPTTAWRMDGSAAGSTLTFAFDGPRTVDQVGLINGLAKVDPVGNEDRYGQNRRLLTVTWLVGDSSFEQSLVDGDRSIQAVRFEPITTSTVQMVINEVSGPGTGTKDRTAISDVLIANE